VHETSSAAGEAGPLENQVGSILSLASQELRQTILWSSTGIRFWTSSHSPTSRSVLRPRIDSDANVLFHPVVVCALQRHGWSVGESVRSGETRAPARSTGSASRGEAGPTTLAEGRWSRFTGPLTTTRRDSCESGCEGTAASGERG